LVEAFAAKGPSLNFEEHDAMLSVLDAIIQLNGRVPPSNSAVLYSQFPTQALILLSHGEPDADAFLLDIFKHEDKQTIAWLAAGNFLMNRKPAGFAATIVADLTVKAHIRVVSQSSPDLPAGYGGSCAFGGGAAKPGWPNVGSYFVSGR